MSQEESGEGTTVFLFAFVFYGAAGNPRAHVQEKFSSGSKEVITINALRESRATDSIFDVPALAST